jgi:hypothetical protein
MNGKVVAMINGPLSFYQHAVSCGRGPEWWAVVSFQKAEIFRLCHLPTIDLVKDAPVEAEDDKLYTISEISSTYRWRR